MKNQGLFVALLLTLLFRHTIPYVDLFFVFLVVQLLLHTDQVQLISLFAVLATLVTTLLYDSPIGLLPLVLAVFLLAFGTLHQKYQHKNNVQLAVWLFFSALCLLVEYSLRATLTVGNFVIPTISYYTIIGTTLAILLITFGLSFKRKL